MCNIAGYAGNENAAPKLLEMLRRQQAFDGGTCTGIATIHDGRIFWRKVVGDVDTLIKTTDALTLPGTVGIAHSRPGGNPSTYAFAHPFLTADEDMAYVCNGTGRGAGYKEKAHAATTFLEEKGYRFRDIAFVEDNFFPMLKNGGHISCVELRMNCVDYLMKEGRTIPEAMAEVLSQLFTDNVSVFINLKEPEKIFAGRITRPMAVLFGSDGTYMSTTRFAFPDEEKGQVVQLPLANVCEITKNGINITDKKIVGYETIQEVTPFAYARGYDMIVEMLTGKKDAPLYFDDLEIGLYNRRNELWQGEPTLIQDARLVYDVLWQLKEEGRLQTIIKPLPGNGHVKDRYYMWLE